MATEPAWGLAPQANAWADAVDEEEAQHGVPPPVLAPVLPETDFPSLGEAVKNKQPAGKAKKAKGQKMDLSSFLGGAGGRNAAPSRTHDNELLLALPKASSGRGPEDRAAGGLGGAFKDYGGQRDGGGRRRGGEDDYERPVSKADTSNDWGAERKFVPNEGGSRGGGFGGGGFGGGGGFRDRGAGGEGGAGGGFREREERRGFDDRPRGEADTTDDWGANRKFVPAAGEDRRGPGGAGGFGQREGGFRERTGPRFDEPSRADAGDWGSRRAPPSPPGGAAAAERGRRGFGFSDASNSAADAEDRWVRRGPPAESSGAAPAAAAAPSERPRLHLAPRTKPIEAVKLSKPAEGAVTPSSGGSPTAAAADGVASPSKADGAAAAAAAAAAPKAPKSNPFGAARPREEVLKEKGIDYVKEELKLEHGEVIRDKTSEETELEKEVEALREQLKGMRELQPEETDTLEQVAAELDDKERHLYKLQAELDDRVRFSKDRPEREAGPRGPIIDPREEAEFVEVRGARRPKPGGEGGEGAAPAAAEAPRGGGGGGSRGWERPGPGGAPEQRREGGGFRERREGPPPPPRREGPPADRRGGGW